MKQFKSILQRQMPEGAVDYCYALREQYPFHFKLRKRRVSKLGDYRFDARDRSHTITVNADLNPFQFLITYIHEVAHRVVHQVGRRPKPHGSHWKSKFQLLMLPVLNPDIFPDDVLRVLAKHMKNPKASASADLHLMKVLANYDQGVIKKLTLEEINVGDNFMLRNRSFRKLETKRSRAICLDLNNDRKYAISLSAHIVI